MEGVAVDTRLIVDLGVCIQDIGQAAFLIIGRIPAALQIVDHANHIVLDHREVIAKCGDFRLIRDSHIAQAGKADLCTDTGVAVGHSANLEATALVDGKQAVLVESLPHQCLPALQTR